MYKLHFFQFNNSIWVKQGTVMGTTDNGAEERPFCDVSISIAPHYQSKPKSPQQENPPTFNLPSVLSLAPSANVSDFIMQSVTVVRSCPVSLFSARAKARISIECGGDKRTDCGRIRRIRIAAYRARTEWLSAPRRNDGGL